MSGAPFVRHSRTSHQAAEAIAPRVTEMQARVLALYGGDLLTDNELIARGVAAGMSANTPRARRVELARMGLVVEAGEVTPPGSRVASMRWRVPAPVRQLDLPLVGPLPW